MDILIVEDNKEICAVLQKAFDEKGLSTVVATDGEKGSALAQKNRYALIILDYALPKKDGLEVCRDIRRSGRNVPVIFLSANDNTNTKVAMLDAGADDYVTKPFCFDELFARATALMRRPRTVQAEVLTIDTLTLDSRTHEVTRNDKQIHLTRKEFMLLEHLMRNTGEVLSRTVLMEHAWGDNIDAFSNTLESHIANVRKKIETSRTKKLIHTISGCGYKIAVDTK